MIVLHNIFLQQIVLDNDIDNAEEDADTKNCILLSESFRKAFFGRMNSN